MWAGLRARRAEEAARASGETARASSFRAQALRLAAEGQFLLSNGDDERALLELVAAARIGRAGEIDSALLNALLARRDLLRMINTSRPWQRRCHARRPPPRLGGSDGTLRLWDAQTGQPIGAPSPGTRAPCGASPSPRTAAASSRAATTTRCGSGTRRPVSRSAPRSPAAREPDVRWHPTCRGLVCGADGTRDSGTPVQSVAVTPDGRRLVSGSGDGTLRLWDAQTGQPIGAPLTGHQGRVLSVAVTPDGRRLVSGGDDDTLACGTRRPGSPSAPRLAATGLRAERGLHPDGRRLVSGGDDGTLRLWDAQTGQPIGAPLTGHQGAVRSVAFSPTAAASSPAAATARCGSGTRNRPAHRRPAHRAPGRVRSVAVTPRRPPPRLRRRRRHAAAMGRADRPADRRAAHRASRLCAERRRHARRPPPRLGRRRRHAAALGRADRPAHRRAAYRAPGLVWSVAFTPDGRRFVSGGGDGTLRLWDAQTGQPIGAPLTGHQGRAERRRQPRRPPPRLRQRRRHAAALGRADRPADRRPAHRAPRRGLERRRQPRRPPPRLGRRRQHAAPVGRADRAAHRRPAHRTPGLGAERRLQPDGRRFVSGGDDNTLRLWDAQTGQPSGPRSPATKAPC